MKTLQALHVKEFTMFSTLGWLCVRGGLMFWGWRLFWTVMMIERKEVLPLNHRNEWVNWSNALRSVIVTSVETTITSPLPVIMSLMPHLFSFVHVVFPSKLGHIKINLIKKKGTFLSGFLGLSMRSLDFWPIYQIYVERSESSHHIGDSFPTGLLGL